MERTEPDIKYPIYKSNHILHSQKERYTCQVIEIQSI